jgi:chaperone BCS1
MIWAQNPMIMGGLMLMLTGAFLAACRQVPVNLWKWIQRRLWVSVEILDEEPMFEWFRLWLYQHPYTKRARALTVSMRGSDEGEMDGVRVVFSPAPGQHWFLYKGRPVWITRHRENQQGGMMAVATGSHKLESFEIRMWGRSQAKVRGLVAEIIEAEKKFRKSLVAVYAPRWGNWHRLRATTGRTMDSVILPSGVKERVLEDMRWFLQAREWYQRQGIPYHRGYLFYGVPGSGKSSLIMALASELKLSLYTLNMAQVGGDAALADLVLGIPHESILLLEDIDSAVPEVRQTKEEADEASDKPGVTVNVPSSSNKVTLSGLLNCLDGVMSREGVLVCMTTNYKDKLDSALIRPGRVDVQQKFDYATQMQLRHMFRSVVKNGTPALEWEFVKACGGRLTMAEVQQKLLQGVVDSQKLQTKEEVRELYPLHTNFELTEENVEKAWAASGD